MTTVEDLSLAQDQASMVLNGHFLGRNRTSTKINSWRIFASCFVPCKKCGFLGFSLLISSCCFCFSKWSSRHPGTLLRKLSDEERLGKVEAQRLRDQNFQLEASTHRTHQFFFSPSYGDLVTSLKTIRFSFSTWKMVVGKRISFCVLPCFAYFSGGENLSFREASPMDALFGCFVEGFQPMISEDATCWRVGQGVLEEGSL